MYREIKAGDICLVIAGPGSGCNCTAEEMVLPGASTEVIIENKGITVNITNEEGDVKWLTTNPRFITPVGEKFFWGFAMIPAKHLIPIGRSGQVFSTKKEEVQITNP